MPITGPAAVAPGAPKQHKQSSRKGKKAWRKNVDVSDVQEGLEELRDQVITGGVITEKDSSELFTLDTTGDAEISKKHLKGSKPLRADEIIASRSKVPAVSMRKRPGEEKVTDGVLQAKRQRTSYVSHKELMRLRNIADGRRDIGESTDVAEATYDPWAMEAPKPEETDPRFAFLPKTTSAKPPPTLKHAPVSLVASGKQIPAVTRPEKGSSYNPDFGEYEERLNQLGAKELEKEQKRLAEKEAEELKLAAAARSAAEAEAAEARAEMSEWDEDSAWEGFESEAEGKKLSAKRPVRKTQAQRNRIKRRKEEERKAKMEANIKKRHDQVAEAKAHAAALAERDAHKSALALAQEQEEGSSSEGEHLELRRRKLGKIALPEKDLELVLPDELQESLRLLKPEGNLLKDRYRSLLVRGKVESRRPISFSKQKKVKATEKWSHKDFVLH